MAENSSALGEKSLYSRQDGTTTIFSMYLLHKAIFQSNINIGILSHKRLHASDVIGMMRDVFEQLPPIFKTGGNAKFNRNDVYFDNGSRIMTFTKTPDNFRGHSLNYLFIDNLHDDVALDILKRETFPFLNARIINIESR